MRFSKAASEAWKGVRDRLMRDVGRGGDAASGLIQGNGSAPSYDAARIFPGEDRSLEERVRRASGVEPQPNSADSIEDPVDVVTPVDAPPQIDVELLNSKLAKAIASEPPITRDVRDVIRNVRGGKPVGTDKRIKELGPYAERVERYIIDHPNCTMEEAASSPPDLLRYTARIPSGRYTSGVNDIVSGLKSKNYKLFRWKNTWDSSGYKGVRSFWVDHRTGQVFEIQIHTPESYKAAVKEHHIYEQRRRLRGQPSIVAVLEEQSNEIFKRVSRPEGWRNIIEPQIDQIDGRR
ncbi:hypothetical protein AB0C34_14900 [Nocardia sp. NPDC049220]|uniref:hypothetical protein n=1 Tax=Nocardia sp. NPDC049220 TaxID=3155273 RepID=UPI0033D7A83A